MKERGTPISLFSFQDIVTSLTGVMVIVILVIVLQLAEARFNYENPKSDNPEYLELKAKMKELTERLRQMREAGEEIPEEYKAYLYSPVEAIELQLQEMEESTSRMNDEKEQNEKEKVTMTLSLRQLKELLKATETEKTEKEKRKEEVNAKLAEAEKDNTAQTLENQLQTLQQESERLKNDIRIAAEKVEFSFVGVMSRQPILIECMENGFRAQVYKSGQPIKEFKGGGMHTNISDLVSWLRSQDLKKSYPLLLLRKGFFPYVDELLLALYRVDEDMVLGQEPLDDKVKVF